MIIAVEGAKGTGKSTLCQFLNNKLSYVIDVTTTHFNADYVVTDARLDDFKIKNGLQLMDRSILSERIYRFLWSNHTIGLGNTLEGFEKFFKSVDKMVILYSSNSDLLKDRILKRSEEVGKGATEQEWQDLIVSNDLFFVYGKHLKRLFPNKIILIDVDIEATEQVVLSYLESEGDMIE